MDREDDPEARIRALEQPLSDIARTSELGSAHGDSAYGYIPAPKGPHPPPPPGAYQYPPTLPYPETGDVVFHAPAAPTRSHGAGVLPVVIGVLALLIAGGVTLFLMVRPSPPTVAGGGATLTDGPVGVPTEPDGEVRNPGRTNIFVPPIVPRTDPAPPAGTNVSISGIGEDEAFACDDHLVSISGVENTVVITGRCASVSVSGIDNVVTIDAAAQIAVSGFDNRIVYRQGEPEVSTSGTGNTVERG
jgi:hypothetical protein